MTISFFYFSGTGNTEYYVDYLINLCEGKVTAAKFDVSNGSVDFTLDIINADTVVFVYPSFYGVASSIIRDFADKYENCFLDKDVGLLSVSTAVSGDSLAPMKKRLERAGACVRFARRLNKPQNMSDRLFSRINTIEENEKVLVREFPKLNEFVSDILKDRRNVRINFFSRLMGICQRLFYEPREARFRRGLRINLAECNYCLRCVRQCPSSNLFVFNQRVCVGDKCAGCYRCINNCPKCAISLNTKNKPTRVFEQAKYKK